MSDPTPAVPAAIVTLLRDWHQAVSAKDVDRVLGHGMLGDGNGRHFGRGGPGSQ